MWLCLYHFPLFGERPDDAASDARVSIAAPGDPAPIQEDWYIINGNSFTLYCGRDVDLKIIARRLGRQGLFTSGVYDPNPASAPSEKVAYRLERLLRRAQDILGMRPNMPDLKIKIFKDRRELDMEYARIFGVTEDYKSFYIHKYRTIYTSEYDIEDSVIAHEMGHAIVDHYFSTVPPEKVGELLASYVDMHLEEE